MRPKSLHATRCLAVLVLCTTPGLGGCAHYFKDRGRDFADVFTLTYDEAIGAKARVGPLAVGLLAAGSSQGLRGGALTSTVVGDPDDQDAQRDVAFLVGGYDNFHPTDKWASLRHKGYTSAGALVYVAEDRIDDSRTHWPYYTQVEAVVGFGAGVRVGVNFGEFFDFLVGFVGLDLYDDDVWESLDERVNLTVVDIEGKPVEDAGCVIDGRTYRSDSDGQIVSARVRGERAVIRMRRGGRFLVEDASDVSGGTVRVGAEGVRYEISGPPGPVKKRRLLPGR